jgi:hypothetical protein
MDGGSGYFGLGNNNTLAIVDVAGAYIVCFSLLFLLSKHQFEKTFYNFIFLPSCLNLLCASLATIIFCDNSNEYQLKSRRSCLGLR